MKVRYRPVASVLILALSFVLSGCGSIFCPGDVAMADSASDIGPHATLAACETARAVATCLPRIAAPTAACTTHCKSGSFPSFCIAGVRNASFIVGNACFPNQADDKYYYRCINQAACTCI